MKCYPILFLNHRTVEGKIFSKMLTVGVVTDIHFVVHCIRNTDKQCWEHVTLIHLYWKPRRKWIDKIGEPLTKRRVRMCARTCLTTAATTQCVDSVIH